MILSKPWKHHLKEEPGGQLLRLSFMVLSSFFFGDFRHLGNTKGQILRCWKDTDFSPLRTYFFSFQERTLPQSLEGISESGQISRHHEPSDSCFFPNQTRSLTLGVGQIHARYSQLVADPSNWEFGTSSQKTPKTLPETTSSHLHLKNGWLEGLPTTLGWRKPGRCELLVSGSVNLSKNPLEVGTMTLTAPWRPLWPCRLCVPPSRPMVWEQTACTEAREIFQVEKSQEGWRTHPKNGGFFPPKSSILREGFPS